MIKTLIPQFDSICKISSIRTQLRSQFHCRKMSIQVRALGLHKFLYFLQKKHLATCQRFFWAGIHPYICLLILYPTVSTLLPQDDILAKQLFLLWIDMAIQYINKEYDMPDYQYDLNNSQRNSTLGNKRQRSQHKDCHHREQGCIPPFLSVW